MEEENNQARVGELVVASHERRAFFRDVELKLTAREFDVLEALAARPGWVFSAGQLADEFGLDGYASPSAVNVHISHLRAKLAAADAPDGFIETVRGAGWRMKRPLRTGVAYGPPFVGRDAELRELEELFGGGTGHFALLVGDPGIGKTALAEHAMDNLTPRFEIFRAVCDGNGSGDHWLWRQLLFEIEERTGAPLSGGPNGILLTRLFGSTTASPAVGLEGADRTLAYRAVAKHLTSALAGHSRPALLFVDDLQWADDASLKLLAYLLKRLETLPFALVATSRQVELASRASLRGVAEHARQCAGSLLVQLKGLQPTDIEMLLQETHCPGPSESLAEVLWGCTAGNPLYVNECLRALSQGVDLTHDLERAIAPSVCGLVSGQVAALPGPCRQLLRAAAVTAAEFDPVLVAHVTELEVSQFDPAIAAGILVERGHAHLRFAHDLFREALLESMDASQRAELHGAIAAAIRRSPADSERRVFVLAHHYARAGASMRPDAVGFLLAAARRSSARFAFEDAAEHLTIALDLLSAIRMPAPRGSRIRAAILERLGATHAALSDVPAAIDDYRRALDARPADDTLARARILTRLACACSRERRRGEATSAFGDALRCLESAQERDTAWCRAWIEVLLSEAEAGFVMETPSSFGEMRDELRAAVERHGTPEQRAKYHSRVAGHLYAANRCSATDECLAEQRLAVAEATTGGSEFLRATTLVQLGGLLVFSGRLAEAESVLRQSLDLNRRCANSMGEAASLFFLAMTARLACDVRATEARALELQQVARERSGMPEFTSGAEAHLGWVALRRGQLDEATAYSERALRIWEQDPAASESVWMMAWPAASCALARDDLDAAMDCIALMSRHGQQSLSGDLDIRIADAVTAFRAGDRATAHSQLRMLETEARGYGYC